MKRTSFFLGGISAVPIVWMWIQIFVFHEAAYLISFGIYLSILYFVVDEMPGNKISRTDQEVQTETRRMVDQYVQTEDLIVSDIESEESEKEVSDTGDHELVSVPGEDDKIVPSETHEPVSGDHELVSDTVEDDIISSETHAMTNDSMEGEESSTLEGDSDFHALSTTLEPQLAYEASLAAERHGIKTRVKKVKFLVPTDPNLFIDDAVPMKDDKVAQWNLQYIKEEHEKRKDEKEKSFFQRKVQKITKLFKKNK